MLSIIIPTLNEEKFLPRLIQSIRKQNFSDYEIIVSDANSSDQTKEIALQNNCNFIVDVDDNHHHPAWQRNNGAKAACGDVLLFLDADTVLQEDFLEKVMKEFNSKKLSSAGFYFKFNPNKFSYRIFSFLYNFFCFFRQYFSPISIGAGIVAKKEFHDLIGGFDHTLCLAEDYDYCQRIGKKGKFRIITSCRLLYSSRRIEKDGFFKVGLAWTRMAFYTFFNRKIKNLKIKYDFGKF